MTSGSDPIGMRKPVYWLTWLVDMFLVLAPLVTLESCHARHCDQRIELWNGRIRIDDIQFAVSMWILALAVNSLICFSAKAYASRGPRTDGPGKPRSWKSQGKQEETSLISRRRAQMDPDWKEIRRWIADYVLYPWHVISVRRVTKALRHYRISFIVYAVLMLVLDHYDRLTVCLYTVPLVFSCMEISRRLILYGIMTD